MFFFNRDAIETVYFRGYEDQDELDYRHDVLELRWLARPPQRITGKRASTVPRRLTLPAMGELEIRDGMIVSKES